MKTYNIIYTKPSNTTASCAIHNWISKSPTSSKHEWWQCTQCGAVKDFKPRVTTTKIVGVITNDN